MFIGFEALTDLINPVNASLERAAGTNGLLIQPLSPDPQLLIDTGKLVRNPLVDRSLVMRALLLWAVLSSSLFFIRSMVSALLNVRSDGGQRFSRLLTFVEISLSCFIVFVACIYLGQWIVEMAHSSLWTDEIATIKNFSAKGLKTALTDYHIANNHIMFNVLNSILPGADSYDPLRARSISFAAVVGCILITLWFYFRRGWYFAGALMLVALTSSWSHLVLMLEARGYGLTAFSGLLLAYSAYAYLKKGSAAALFGAVLGAVAGTLALPTFGLYGLPLLGLLFLMNRDRRTFLAVAASYLIIATVYIPLIPEMIRINSGYEERWAAEFGSFRAVPLTLKHYLFPDTGVALSWAVLLLIGVIAVLPWRRIAPSAAFTAWQPVALSIILFFAACLFLRTPAGRTAAFICLPFAAVLLSLVAWRPVKLWQQSFWTVLQIWLAVLIYNDISAKGETLDRYYQPNENWKAAAELVSHVFPSSDIIVFNNFRSGFLQKYLPEEYEVVENFSYEDYITGKQMVIDSHPWNNPRFGASEYFSESLSFRVPQVRGDYQEIIYELQPGFSTFDLSIPGDSARAPVSIPKVAELNRHFEYIDERTIEVRFDKPVELCSFNILGLGIKKEDVVSIMGMSNGRWQQIATNRVAMFYREGRAWQRAPRGAATMLSVNLNGEGTYERLQFNLAPASPGETFLIDSTWYRLRSI